MSNIPTGLSTIPETERRRAVPVYRCRVSTCWHTALPDSDLCAGCYADAMEHTRDGCPDGPCEICHDDNSEWVA